MIGQPWRREGQTAGNESLQPTIRIPDPAVFASGENLRMKINTAQMRTEAFISLGASGFNGSSN